MRSARANGGVSFGGSAFTDFLSKNGLALLMLLPMLMIAWQILGGASRFAIGGPTMADRPSPTRAVSASIDA